MDTPQDGRAGAGWYPAPGIAPPDFPRVSVDAPLEVTKDGQEWRLGTSAHVAWIVGHTTQGTSITTAIPPVFDAYATAYPPDGINCGAHERALVEVLTAHTPEQPWWLGYLDTGAHDVVFPASSRVSLYWDWPYVLVEAGPEQALTWRIGHMRGDGPLPDLVFPADRSWLVSALWDDTWIDIGGGEPLISALQSHPLIKAARVGPDEDCLPPGLVRD